MINSLDLNEYISLGHSAGFFGYGKWEHPIYVIGIEEGGCYSEDLIQQKIDRYKFLSFGDDGLFDNLQYQGKLKDPLDVKLPDYSKFFNSSTTKKSGYVPKVVRMLIEMEGSKLNANEYTASMFGGRKAHHTLIELFPLPCPKEKNWLYPKWVDLNRVPFMNKKEDYRKSVIDFRIAKICNKISKSSSPKTIIFFGIGSEKIDYWNKISPIKVQNYKDIPGLPGIKFHRESKHHLYILSPFPSSHSANGICNRNDQMKQLGQLITKL